MVDQSYLINQSYAITMLLLMKFLPFYPLIILNVVFLLLRFSSMDNNNSLWANSFKSMILSLAFSSSEFMLMSS
jgi:hypothetical protein